MSGTDLSKRWVMAQIISHAQPDPRCIYVVAGEGGQGFDPE